VQHLGALGRLHEQLILVQPDPRFRRRGTSGEHDGRTTRTTHGDRELRRDEAALTQRLTDDQAIFLAIDGTRAGLAQILSSQRITTGEGTTPGTTLISRRTSR
jgi:hypothetical protein